MSNEKFRRTLERLHRELQDAESLDEETRQLLTHVDSDIQQILKDEVSKTTTAHRSLNDRLKEAVGAMESTNPDLTETMRQIITTLTNMGI